MMRLPGRGDLGALLESPEDISVSIYLPTQRTGDVQQGAIRFKNLLRDAEEKLLVQGLRQPEAERLLAGARALLDDPLFWHHQSEGLAVFLSAATFTWFRLPYRLAEAVVVAERFHLNPLLPLFSADGIFYVLGLSQNKVSLVQCSRDGAREVTPDVLPGSMADVLQYDDVSRNLQFRSGPSQGAAGRGGAMYHGHGAGKDEAKDNIVRFLREVDRGLRDTLKDQQAPVMLAGVGYLRALFREVSTYPGLVEQGIEGNPDELSPAELQIKAWPIMETYFLQERETALARYGEGSARGLTQDRLEDILWSAHDGRVAVLFVAMGTHVWGQAFVRERRVESHEAYQPGDDDLVDSAVVAALLSGATVHVVPPGQVPGGVLAAALLRY